MRKQIRDLIERRAAGLSNEGLLDTKVCIKCDERKPLTAFYAHPQMADGRLNKCKECAKQDAKTTRKANPEHYREYDQNRDQLPERKTVKYASVARAMEKFPEKRAARTAVSNALRDGRLVKQPCAVCGDPETEGHHKDYSKPLDVDWLCKKHHVEADKALLAA